MRRWTYRCAVVAVVSSLACGGGGSGGGGSNDSASTSMVVGSGGGTVSLQSGPTLTIPAGALSADTTITIAKSSAAAPGGALGSLYQFGPDGTVFAQPVTVTFSVPEGTSAASIYWTHAGSSTEYESLPTTIVGTSVSAQVSHFSAGFVGASCTEGDSCTPSSACHVGAIGCGTGTPVCADTAANVADGSSCGMASTCQAGVCTATGTEYSLADLVGTWEMNALVSPGPGWLRGPVTVAEDGSAVINWETFWGSDTGENVFLISPAGVVTVETSSTYRAVMDLDKTIMVGTSSSVPGDLGYGMPLYVFVKPAQEASLSDLAGSWEGNVLVSDAPGTPGWARIRLTVAADGSYVASETTSGGQEDENDGTFEITASGVVTETGRTYRGILEAGETIMVLSGTGSDSQSAWLQVVVKMADEYSSSDLVGTWEVNSLATGPGAPWWERARITIAADGTFTGASTDSSGENDPISETLYISADGVVTLAGSTSFRGVMDAGKTIIAVTDTWSTGDDAGTTELKVLTRVE